MFFSRDDEDELGQFPASAPVAEKAAEPTPEQMQANQAKRNRLLNGLASIADNHSSENSYGNYWLKMLNPESTSARDLAAKIQKDEDPIARQEKAAAYLKAKREMAKADPSSDSSKRKAELIAGVFPKFAPYITGKSDAELDEIMPILSQVARGDEDRALRREEASWRRQDRQDALAEKADAKALKQKELSATQAKQRGLYEMGKAAEGQYSAAVADKNNYDPTSVGQWIDNSNWAPNFLKNDKAIESQQAQKSWIESFLRDASGAAIPESERQAYAEIYFPQPGDPADVVRNKAALRAQKMDSARVAAGVETGHGPDDMPVAQSPQVSPLKQAIAEEKARRARLKNTAAR